MSTDVFANLREVGGYVRALIRRPNNFDYLASQLRSEAGLEEFLDELSRGLDWTTEIRNEVKRQIRNLGQFTTGPDQVLLIVELFG